jgi:YD repeat-containing protein
MRKIFLAGLFLSFCVVSRGQDSAPATDLKITPPSADAAALGKYGNIPVGMYTGVPDISIPLHEIRYRDITIPLKLSYHASGIQVEEDASYVGLGWALHAGGVITRTTRGGDDMQHAGDLFSTMGNANYDGYPYDQEVPDGENMPPSYVEKICNKEIDAEPDLFYFSFMGQSGRFVLEQGQDKNAPMLKGTPLKTEMITIQYDVNADHWRVLTKDGYQYIFKAREVLEILRGSVSRPLYDESNIDFFLHSYSDDIVVSAWYLTKIISPSGLEVEYIYDLTVLSGQQVSLYGSAKHSYSEHRDQIVEMPAGANCWPDRESWVISGTVTFTSHVYLKEIRHPLGKVLFTYSDREDLLSVKNSPAKPYYKSWLNHNSNAKGPQKLDAIAIVDKGNNLVRNFSLGYGYYNRDRNGTDAHFFKRLRLDRLQECGSGGECEAKYQFSYDPGTLPSKISVEQDFWGYYNGATSNTSRIPRGTYKNSANQIEIVGTADRHPNAAYMQTGILKKITYPTGGTTEFIYEPHAYSIFGESAFAYTDFARNSTERVILKNAAGIYAKEAGGLRIKEIIDKTATNATAQLKRFDYTYTDANGERRSTGRLMQFPSYHVLNTTTLHDPQCPITFRNMESSSWPNLPLGTSASGSIVGYDKVTVTDGGPGKSEYHYINKEESLPAGAIFIEGLPNIINTSNGLLDLENHYTANDALRKSIDYFYEPDNFNRKEVRGVAFKRLNQIYSEIGGATRDISCLSYQAAQPYKVISDRYMMVKKLETENFPETGDSFWTIEEYKYNIYPHLQLTEHRSFTSDHTAIVTRYTYPPDANWIPAGMWSDHHLYDKVVQKTVEVNNELTETHKSFYIQAGTTFQVEKEQVATGENALEVYSTYSYYPEGLLKQVNTRKGLNKFYLWGYNNIFPIAEITAGDSEKFAFTSFESGPNEGNWQFTISANKTDSKTGKQSHHVSASPVTCAGLDAAKRYVIGFWAKGSPAVSNAVEHNDAPGADANGWRYYEKVISGTSTVTVSGQAGTLIDELRLCVAGAQMQTYSYDLFKGISSKTDFNGTVTQFDFDGLGRLKHIRDSDGNIIKNYSYQFKAH